MIRVYQATNDRGIAYLGNKLYPPIKNVLRVNWPPRDLAKRVESIAKDKKWYHLHKIDSAIFRATVQYFNKLKADWVNLPLTTLMISSPGEVYAGQKLNYTTDTLPIEISNWFNSGRRVFLSESSQFYLELRLIMSNVDKVFSIYNSFRKESADATHLSEFQHIEFEGHVNFDENIQIFTGLIDFIINYLLTNNEKSLAYFLTNKDLKYLSHGIRKDIMTLTFDEALSSLQQETKHKKYNEFSMKNFGSWEEILLTQIHNSHILIKNFPMLQIPFYHKVAKEKINGIPVAENADLILSGYRETVGSGVRVNNPRSLAEKARIFNLPKDDYKPYLQTRKFKGYRPSAGFGLGWQRFTQWLLKLPFIWDTTPTPRGQTIPRP